MAAPAGPRKCAMFQAYNVERAEAAEVRGAPRPAWAFFDFAEAQLWGSMWEEAASAPL